MIKTDSRVFYWGISSLLIVFCAVLSLLNEGSFRYMCSDDSVIFAATNKKYNPDLYPKDLQVNTVNNSYLTYYYDAVYHLSRVVGVKTACFIFHVLGRLLFFIALLFLSRSIFLEPVIGWISLLIFVLPKETYGTVTLSASLHPQYLAMPLLLIGLGFLFRKKIIIFTVILSSLLYIHATTAIWGTLIGFFCWLGISGYKYTLQSLGAFVWGSIIAVPFLQQYCHSGAYGGGIFLSIQQMESLSRWRISPHMFPLSWDPLYNIFKLLTIALMVFLGYSGLRKKPVLITLFICFTLGTIFIWGAGFIFSEVHYLPIMNKMQLFRSSSIELVLFAIFLANFVWNFGKECLKGKKYLSVFILYMGLLCFAGVGVGRRQLLGSAIMVLSVFMSNRKIDVFIGKIAGVVKRWYGKYGLSRALFSIFLVIVCGAAIFEMQGMMIYYKNAKTIDEPLKEAAMWAQANTPVDALFVTPPVEEGFRYWSQRSQLANWKDGGLGNYDARFGVYFLKVMKAYGFYPGMNENYLAGISAEQIISVGHQFGADYAVLPETEHAVSEKTVFKNYSWRILKLR